MKKLSVKEVVSLCCNAPITGVNINGESSAWCEKCGKPHLPSKTRDGSQGNDYVEPKYAIKGDKLNSGSVKEVEGELAKDQRDQMELRERVIHNKLKSQYEETSGLKQQIKDMLDEASNANVETNEAPVESVSQPKAVDGYLKEFDERFAMRPEFDGKFMKQATYVKDVTDFFEPVIERARREGYEEGGLDALERYLYLQKRDKENIKFWKEWWIKCLLLDKELL